MDSRDIEAQIKSLIGINLDQVPTGTLPLAQTKGMSLIVIILLWKDPDPWSYINIIFCLS